MKKFRTYKNYNLLYNLEKSECGFIVSIEKSSIDGVEKSTYIVNSTEIELKSLLCRLWRCGVTPMSLIYVLEDEGYLPKYVESQNVIPKQLEHIVKRKRRDYKLNEGLNLNDGASAAVDSKTCTAVGCKTDT